MAATGEIREVIYYDIRLFRTTLNHFDLFCFMQVIDASARRLSTVELTHGRYVVAGVAAALAGEGV
jgi:hypothetical protein